MVCVRTSVRLRHIFSIILEHKRKISGYFISCSLRTFQTQYLTEQNSFYCFSDECVAPYANRLRKYAFVYAKHFSAGLRSINFNFIVVVSRIMVIASKSESIASGIPKRIKFQSHRVANCTFFIASELLKLNWHWIDDFFWLNIFYASIQLWACQISTNDRTSAFWIARKHVNVICCCETA